MPWVYVDDLEAHFAHAKAAGATIVSEIQEQGYRAYEAEDLEGRRWTFVQARPTRWPDSLVPGVLRWSTSRKAPGSRRRCTGSSPRTREPGLERADDDHYLSIGEKLAAGRLIPFLGAGANLCDRGGEAWAAGRPFLPSGSELADHLAARGRYPDPDDRNLLRVSQYVRSAESEEELYLYLREVFASDYAPTSLHRLLARVARLLADTGRPQLLAVTTNYDDLLEQALADEGLEFDVVWYEAKQNSAANGRFVHRAPGKKPKAVARPNKYTGLPMTLERPAVLKLHGCLVRDSPAEDSYVITEDSYIDYLSGGDLGALIPIALWQRLTTSNFLFLGYSLSDWNLRVILNRIWGTRKLVGRWWAVQREPDDPKIAKIERTLWDGRENVTLVYCELSEYVKNLEGRLPLAAAAAEPA
jgi:hypothetical protein